MFSLLKKSYLHCWNKAEAEKERKGKTACASPCVVIIVELWCVVVVVVIFTELYQACISFSFFEEKEQWGKRDTHWDTSTLKMRATTSLRGGFTNIDTVMDRERRDPVEGVRRYILVEGKGERKKIYTQAKHADVCNLEHVLLPLATSSVSSGCTLLCITLSQPFWFRLEHCSHSLASS